MHLLKQIALLSLILGLGMAGCAKKENTEIIGGADEPTTIVIESEISKDEPKETESDIITDDQAIAAIRNYCHINNPDLADIEKAGEYPVYWEIASSNDKEIVVLFRSYTGAQVRYYINPISGDTYVTEFVPGITEDEERTDESFNVKDYISENDPSAEKVSSIPGTWATASMGYEYKETVITSTQKYRLFSHTQIYPEQHPIRSLCFRKKAYLPSYILLPLDQWPLSAHI